MFLVRASHLRDRTSGFTHNQSSFRSFGSTGIDCLRLQQSFVVLSALLPLLPTPCLCETTPRRFIEGGYCFPPSRSPFARHGLPKMTPTAPEAVYLVLNILGFLLFVTFAFAALCGFFYTLMLNMEDHPRWTIFLLICMTLWELLRNSTGPVNQAQA